MVAAVLAVLTAGSWIQDPAPVEGQPLAAQVARMVQALELIGRPLPADLVKSLESAGRDARKIQELLKPYLLLDLFLGDTVVLQRGPAAAVLQESGYTPHLIRILNDRGSLKTLRTGSRQAGPVYSGVAELSMQRQNQKPLRENENVRGEPRILDLEQVTSPPLLPGLSGLHVEYVVLLIYSSVPGKLAATLEIEGASVAIDFVAAPAVPVKLTILEADGTPSTARLEFTDSSGHVYPPQPKRLAPDLFFQKQIYRHHGETVLLPPGRFGVVYSRGPEYLSIEKEIDVPSSGPGAATIHLRRWVDARAAGYYSGDHHIHAAGCAHYTKPSEGVLPPDMFRQVKGEGLNVGCLLTWGPCYDYQKQFFLPTVDALSEPLTLLKYDVEVSGFGSQALGHVCLLNLKDQAYPGSEGAKKWPTWTTPVLRWAKQQGAVTGYAHSASGLQVAPANAARRLIGQLDRDRDGKLSAEEAGAGLLPEDFARVDADGDGVATEAELTRSADRSADQLPGFAIPEMNSVGAMEIFVSVPEGLCDFISAMDTARIPEWNCWYHLLNCGFPLKVSGETDFPCMSGTRVGQGRVYVQLGKGEKLGFSAWCDGLARGKSYVSDGYAHALEFSVNGKAAGEEVALEGAATVQVRTTVAFSSQTPVDTPYGGVQPSGGKRLMGDTVNLHAGERLKANHRLVEIVMNGIPVDSKIVPADGRPHEVSFAVPVSRSSWVALRHFPELHTNPVNVLVAGKPIRASRRSALWSIGCIEQLWRMRGQGISPGERDEAKKAFDAAIERYRKIAAESPEGS